jgi:hypothetical protein
MTEMIFDTCQWRGGYVWCNVVRDLIVERWQTLFSDTIQQSFWNPLFKGTRRVKSPNEF